MPNIIENINVNVSTGDLDMQIGLQVQQLEQIVQLIRQFAEQPPRDVTDFLNIAANMPTPSFSASGDIGSGLQTLQNLLPSDLSSLTAGLDGQLEGFTQLIQDQLEPLLGSSVRVAMAIEKLVTMDFRCEGHGPQPTPPAANEPEPDEPPDPDAEPATPNPGAERLAQVANQVDAANSYLALMPDELSPRALVSFLINLTDNGKPRAFMAEMPLPLIDDLIEPLQTLNRWFELNPSEIAAEIAATIARLIELLTSAGSGKLATLGADLTALQAELNLPQLNSFCEAMLTHLGELRPLLQAQDTAALAPLVATMTTTLDGIADTFNAYDAGVAAQCRTINTRLGTLVDTIFDELSHLASLLEAPDWTGQLPMMLPDFTPPPAEAVAAVEEAIAPLTNWLAELTEKLDFSGLQGEVGAIAGQAQALANALDDGLNDIAVQTGSLFGEARQQIQGLGLSSLHDELMAQINGFGTRLRQTLQGGFAPAANALTDGVTQLSGALDDFDPEVIVNALRDVLQAITDVLNGAEIQNAVNQIRQAIATITEVLQQLSFSPVTDEVVALIEKMTDALRTLTQSDMSDAAKAALAVALQILPDDLEPVTRPLLAEFDDLIKTGPVPMLEVVAEKPAELLSAITRFRPADLIGSQLTQPFETALAQAEAFRPSTLMANAEQELAKARNQLTQVAQPSKALAPLSAQFRLVEDRIRQYSPDNLLKPLEEQVQNTIADVIANSPVDDVFEQINRVFGIIEQALAVPRNLQQTLERVVDLLQSTANADNAIDTWRDDVVGKLSGPGTQAIDAALDDLAQAIQGNTHNQLMNAYDQATQPLRDALNDLRPGQRLTALNRLYGEVRQLANQLPDSPEKSDLLTALGRFDPRQAGPVQTVNQLHQKLDSARLQLSQKATDFQTLLGDHSSALQVMLRDIQGGSGVQGLVNQALEPALIPLRQLYQLFQYCLPAAESMLRQITQLIGELTNSLGDLLTGPESLHAITQAAQQVVDTLRNIDLSFLRENLQALFDDLLNELRILDPSTLGTNLDQAFADLLDGLTLDDVIDPAAIASLDSSYVATLEKLRSLNPASLVESVVQPEYEATIVPLVSAFDLTPAFQALIDFLLGLTEELDTELGRVNAAYKTLRAARPSLTDSININISL